ncbi:MAG: hypothetical protein WD271_05810 [Acidimicrobiia bacterium]
MTQYGPLDIVFTPDGAPGGFSDLEGSAEEQQVESPGSRALVISVATWERLEQTSGRAKDLEHLDRFSEGRESE